MARQFSNFSVAGILGFDERQAVRTAALPLYPSSETKTSTDPEEDIFSSPSPSPSPCRVSARTVSPVPARDLNSTGESPSPPLVASGAGALRKSSNTESEETSNGSSSKEPAKRSVSTSSSQDPQPDLDDEQPPKKKRQRTTFTGVQLSILAARFKQEAFPDIQQLKSISEETDIVIPKLQVWFQNRRAKARKYSEVLHTKSSKDTNSCDSKYSQLPTKNFDPLQPPATSQPSPMPYLHPSIRHPLSTPPLYPAYYQPQTFRTGHSLFQPSHPTYTFPYNLLQAPTWPPVSLNPPPPEAPSITTSTTH